MLQKAQRIFNQKKERIMNKFLNKLLMAGVLLASMSLSADLPQPYASVQNLPQKPYFVLDGYVYYSLISAHGAAVIVDVESHEGGVARFIAQQAGNLPSLNQIFSISAWQSPDSSQKHLFQQFLSNVIQENTAESIIPIRMSSQEAADALGITADFISLVGGNDQNGIFNDILAWFPHLSDNGVLCGNNWHEKNVQIGVTRAAAVLDLTLNINSNVWYFVKGSN